MMKFVRGGLGKLGCLVVFLTGTLPALAQLPTGTILGVVRDSTGAVVPGVTMTARNTETDLTRATVTGSDGRYRFSALPVGPYEVRAAQSGFRTEVRSGLTLAVSQEAVVDFSLQLGAVAETVTVTAEAPLVNTTSGTLGALVDQQKVADLPLNGRNYIDLTLLQPGINQSRTTGSQMQYAGTWYSSNGAPVISNNYMLDGAIMTNPGGVTTASVGGTTLGVEGIREYRVMTNSFSAEYGMAMGSQMMIVSKNGTNQFHGSLFEYLRNSALDARNFFDYQSPTTKPGFRLPAFTRNNFGGSIGGPIKKDKTFFHTTLEAVRERKGLTNVQPVPGAGCHGPAGATITNAVCPQLGTLSSATIAPAIAPLLALYPAPNLPGNQFTFPYSQPLNEIYGQIRVDQTFSTDDSLFGRYTIDDGEKVQPETFPAFTDDGRTRNQFLTLSESHVFSPTLLNTVRYSYSLPILTITSPFPDLINGPQYQFIPGQAMGQISVTGVAAIGPGPTYPRTFKQEVHTLSDDVFLTQGRSAWKFGTLINRYRQYVQQSFNRGGSPVFPSVAAFLQGLPSSLTQPRIGSLTYRTFSFYTMGFYVQNDFKPLPNLTLNLGLRYEFQTQMNEVHGDSSAIRDLAHDAAPTLGIPYKNPSMKNYSPRFGFAWDVGGNGKTSVRGGFGLLYDLANMGTVLVQTVSGTPPFSAFSQVNSQPNNPLSFTVPFQIPDIASGNTLRVVEYNLQQPHMLQYNLSVERQLPANAAVTLSYAGSRGINLLTTLEGNPIIPQVHPDGRYFWPVVPAGVNPRVNPTWGSAETKSASADSFYNSLQFSVVKRMSRGLQFQSSFTWARIIDDAQSLGSVHTGGTSHQAQIDPLARAVDRGLANFDVKYNWRFNLIYRVPELLSRQSLAGKLLNGWQIGTIVSMQGGQPLTLGLSSNRSRSGVLGNQNGLDRPDLVPGVNQGDVTSGVSRCTGVLAGKPLGTPNLWFDPCAFAVPEAGYLGNVGRNTLRVPGLQDVDFSLMKDASLRFLGEGGKLEFRAEVFNILNKANFGVPARIVYAATSQNFGPNAEAPINNAGQITNTIGDARQIQLALKIIF